MIELFLLMIVLVNPLIKAGKPRRAKKNPAFIEDFLLPSAGPLFEL